METRTLWYWSNENRESHTSRTRGEVFKILAVGSLDPGFSSCFASDGQGFEKNLILQDNDGIVAAQITRNADEQRHNGIFRLDKFASWPLASRVNFCGWKQLKR